MVADFDLTKKYSADRLGGGGREDEFSRATSLATLDGDSDAPASRWRPVLSFSGRGNRYNCQSARATSSTRHRETLEHVFFLINWLPH